MKDKELQKLRDNYFDAITYLQDPEDIKSALPNTEYFSFFPLIDGLIGKLEEELSDYLSLKEKDSYIAQEIEVIKLKISLCQERKKEALEKTQIESPDDKKGRHLIFATTTEGNVYLEKDLKDIPEEYWQVLENMINTLEQGNLMENIEKSRPLISNRKLSGIYELKEFKIRLVYRVLGNNAMYVMLARMKKDDRSLIDREEIIRRKKNTEQEYNELKKIVKDPDQLDLLLMQQEPIKGRIYSTLEKGKRGEQNGK